MALTDDMRGSLNVEDARSVLSPLLMPLAFLLLFVAALLTPWIKGWRNKLAACLVIVAIAIMTF